MYTLHFRSEHIVENILNSDKCRKHIHSKKRFLWQVELQYSPNDKTEQTNELINTEQAKIKFVFVEKELKQSRIKSAEKQTRVKINFTQSLGPISP